MYDLKILKRLTKIAHGKGTPDVLIKDVQIVDVLSGRIFKDSVAISNGIIVGFGDYKSKEILDGKGAFLLPSFMDAHIHIESTMLSPSSFARAVIPHGTAAVISDPHEIANVSGIRGIKWMIEDSKGLPMDIFFMAPSCVPATPFETSGAEIGAEEINELLKEERVLGLAEVMNYPGVIRGDASILEKIKVSSDYPKDGHAPFVLGKDLNAYLISGIGTDHECTRLEEASEKLSKGMRIFIREGSSEKNMKELINLVTPYNCNRICLVSDDKSPDDLIDGHLDLLLKKAVGYGIDPILAIRMVSLSVCEAYRLERRGAIAIGFRADLALLSDLKEFKVIWTMKDGRIVAREGEVLEDIRPKKVPKRLLNTIHIAKGWEEKIKIHRRGKRIRVIGVVEGQIITDALVVSDIKDDICKIAVIERHHKTGNVGLGFVKGFGLKSGAMASTVAHDSHNIVVIGTNDLDMIIAVKEIERAGGGQVVVGNGRVLEMLPLPICGLMTNKSIEETAKKVRGLKRAARSIGCKISEPFMQLSFLALPVIPYLKMTDMGLFDVKRFRHTPLWV